MKQYTLEEFLEDLGARESSGNYSAVNSAGYLGKYQMGGGALTDAGYYKLNPNGSENDWKGQFTGKDNVYSKEDFLNNPQAQENAIRAYSKRQWQSLQSNGATKAVGSTINGIPITESGLIAGAHLVGQGNAGDYIRSNGKYIPQDANKTSIEEYLKNYGGYDVSELIDPNYYAPAIAQNKEDAVMQRINQGTNLISRVAAQAMPSTPLSGKDLNSIPTPPPLSREEWLKRLRRNRKGLN